MKTNICISGHGSRFKLSWSNWRIFFSSNVHNFYILMFFSIYFINSKIEKKHATNKCNITTAEKNLDLRLVWKWLECVFYCDREFSTSPMHPKQHQRWVHHSQAFVSINLSLLSTRIRVISKDTLTGPKQVPVTPL